MSSDSLKHKLIKANLRSQRTRRLMNGTAQRPRLSVHISNQNISAQIINDEAGQTMATATTASQKTTGTMGEQAALIGDQIAQKAQKAKIKKVVFDRGKHQYHGRIKQLAEAARAGGLEF